MIAEEKQRLRSGLLKTLRELTPAEKLRQSREIGRLLTAQPLWGSARRVFAFHPLGDEPAIFSLLISRGGFCLPRIDKEIMRFYPVADPHSLRPGPHGILEPKPTDEEVLPAQEDLLLVPGLAFSRDGCRLGRGGGFYDRFLEGCSAATLGVCFYQQILSNLPMAAHDQRVGGVIFPEAGR